MSHLADERAARKNGLTTASLISRFARAPLWLVEGAARAHWKCARKEACPVERQGVLDKPLHISITGSSCTRSTASRPSVDSWGSTSTNIIACCRIRRFAARPRTRGISAPGTRCRHTCGQARLPRAEHASKPIDRRPARRARQSTRPRDHGVLPAVPATGTRRPRASGGDAGRTGDRTPHEWRAELCRGSESLPVSSPRAA